MSVLAREAVSTPARADAAVVLLSGGLDSSTVLALARAKGHRLFALSFAYGQRHAIELEYARRQAQAAGVVAHEIVDLRHFGQLVATASALVQGSPLAVDKEGGVIGQAIPTTYVPARNALFLTYALGWAEVVQARSIYLGVNAMDYSGYPDCRPAFIDAFARMANLATKAGVSGQTLEVHTPLIALTKAQIIALGCTHGVDFRNTVSCYDPQIVSGATGDQALACGRCESCRLRAAGFAAAGIADPAAHLA